MKLSKVTLMTFAVAISFLMLILLITALPARAAIAIDVTIERFVYSGQVSGQYDEYVKICNISGGSVDLGGANPWRIGDEENAAGGAEGMYNLTGSLSIGSCFIIASNANAFSSTWHFLPDYEMRPTIGSTWTDNESVPNLVRIGSGNWALNDSGDNITLWKYEGSSYVKHDEVAYDTDSTNYTDVGLSTTGSYSITCSGNAAVTRNSVNTDTDNMYADFNCTANPNAVTLHALTAGGFEVALPTRLLLTTGAVMSLAIGILPRWIRKR
jgi:hypothetical protein